MSRTLIVGDVHSCADELRQLLEETQPTRVILVGDVFNKGPDPQGTWALVQDWRAESVLGNHDLKVSKLAKRGEMLAPEAAVAWLRDLPITIEGDGWVVVHGGLNPVGETTRSQAVRLRRWPDDKDLSNPFWWECYTGDKLVIYGHDAMRGLQDHRPHTLGLDTGCVYGGDLTGYLLEEDRIVSVPADRGYFG